MNAYKLEVFVIDFDHVGADSIKDMICNARYPNHCISPSVEAIQCADIGIWTDDHPLNKSDTCAAEYARLFAERTPSAGSAANAERQASSAVLSDEQLLDKPLPELLGLYWDIAYSEGKTGVSRGTEAQLVLSSILSAAAAQPAPTIAQQPVAQKPYGWLTGESTSHRQGNLQDLTTNYEWAKEICDKNNAENRFIDSDWVDEVPAPLYAAAQAISKPPEQGSSLYAALQRAFDELLPYTSIRIQAERGIGWVEWKDTKGQWHVIDGDGWLCSDITDALDKITSCTTGDAAIGEKGNG